MNVPRAKPVRLIILAAGVLLLLGGGSYLYLWHYSPTGVRKVMIRVFSATKWTEYERLTKLLSLGTPPAEVEEILGKPAHVDALSLGQRWIYGEDDSTAGWTYIAEFERGPAGNLSLCYVVNIQHRAFRDSPRSELGRRLDLKKPEGTILLGYPAVPKENLSTNGGESQRRQ